LRGLGKEIQGFFDRRPQVKVDRLQRELAGLDLREI
jgi:hypothetical protein